MRSNNTTGEECGVLDPERAGESEIYKFRSRKINRYVHTYINVHLIYIYVCVCVRVRVYICIYVCV